MGKKYLLIIEVIGFLILLFLGVSIIQNIIILIFSNKISYFWLTIIRFVSALVLIEIMIKTTWFGKDIYNLLIRIENKIFKKKK